MPTMFSRLRCHFCGSKTPHNKTTTEFQCTSCEAFNYLDGKGNIVDTPTYITAPHQTEPTNTTSFSFPRPINESLNHQENQAFCRTCVQNQHMYNENLANYLPDEDHPRYAEFEKAIPKFKAELEQRYPLICKNCAPKAQTKINRADYYGMAQNAARLVSDTRARGGKPATGMRDDAGKKMARFLLSTVGLILNVGLAVQIAYHVYGILMMLYAQEEDEIDDSLAGLSPAECAVQARSLRFSASCFDMFGSIMPKMLALAAIGLLHNPGRKAWYHPTFRMDAVHGQWNYFYMHLIILAVRSLAWLNLSHTPTTAKFDSQQLIGAHSFTIFFILIIQLIASRGIQPVQWRLKGKIMPKPTEVDILSAHAAPASEHPTPKASERNPYRYLHHPEDQPLDVNNFAAKSTRSAQQPYTRGSYLPLQQPSPEYSDEEDDSYYDRMETDSAPVMRSSQRSLRTIPQPVLRPTHTLPPTCATTTSLQTQPSNPFYTRLPPAPLSQNHRLRNPPHVPNELVPVPLSQRPDFLKRMGEQVKPVEFAPRKRTEFELKPSSWVLPGDVRETGLEGRFESTFRLEDEVEVTGGENRGRKKGFFGGLFGF
ncbi:unnamed protein product [Zymoseptoria tritici ST99CH_3D7]|uniref:Ima1 N-terminal domain-containing protein n=1 Tax=Zymoseptoria tritici (strain ST99CH_3D7) TaxID=1276538 RepID=A0A1X7S8F8_ZYMT9|nr:unnamed protein product [Zymoseptoria tritici ST99CH_3D7]